MTCIVALAHEDKVYLGGDSCATVDSVLQLIGGGKVFRSGEYLMGSAGSGRMNTILRHAFKPPTPSKSLDRFMATEFSQAMRECLKKNGYLQIENERQSAKDEGVIIGVRGRVFYCDEAFSIVRMWDGVCATGSGSGYALGVLHATPKHPPRQRIRLALEAAERWDGGVMRPFHIKSVG